MSSLLLYLQHDNGVLLPASLSAITAAKRLKSVWGLTELVGVCLGAGSSNAATASLAYGLSRVSFCADAALEKFTPESYSHAVTSLLQQLGCTTFVLPATAQGKDFAPRVSVHLDAGQASDVIAINDDGSLKRPIYAGNAIADVQIKTNAKVVTIRPTGFDPCQAEGVSGTTSEFSVDFSGVNASEVMAYNFATSDRPELGAAKVVVSGGRALKSAENFEKFLYPLADSLGAAVGASRAAVDSGYAPNDWQVGQTGKVVAPQLYIAVGISGAIQHLAGMKDSKTIVAINSDPAAPIFEVADYGLVADLFEVVPQLTEAIKKGCNRAG
jgi:electron transfer flavoprotein alpha subunit